MFWTKTKLTVKFHLLVHAQYPDQLVHTWQTTKVFGNKTNNNAANNLYYQNVTTHYHQRHHQVDLSHQRHHQVDHSHQVDLSHHQEVDQQHMVVHSLKIVKNLMDQHV